MSDQKRYKDFVSGLVIVASVSTRCPPCSPPAKYDGANTRARQYLLISSSATSSGHILQS